MGSGNYGINNDKRFFSLAIFTVILTVVLVARLFTMQVIKGDEYASKVTRSSAITTTIYGARGEIYDRYGRALVVNRVSYNIELNRATLSTSNQNDVMLALLKILDEDTLVYTDILPISQYPYTYLKGETEEEQARIDKRIAAMLKTFGLKTGTTAEAAMAKIKSTYGLKKYSDADARLLAGLRYDITNTGFTRKKPYVMAKDVSEEILAIIAENTDGTYSGAEVVVSTTREYATDLLAHVLGTVGKIPDGDLEEYLENGYVISDIVGRDGVEYTAEEWLRAKNGYRTTVTDTDGNLVVLEEEPAANGNNLYLTIDLELQEVGENSLRETIAAIVEKSETRSDGYGADCDAGSFVMLDAKTAEVLAMGSYPTFDLSTYRQNYNELAADPANPLYNRAISGLYAPGSTYKMCTALAALKSGAITTKTFVDCTGVYTRFSPYNYYCWIYSDRGTNHGVLDVTGGLKHSCNLFFYEAGYRTGIDALAYWTDRLGLGSKTGIELQGEQKGSIATPEYAASVGDTWSNGQTITAAIGQSFHAFTPIQLANYVATIVNGGYRNQVTIFDSVRNYSNTMSVWQNRTQQLDDLEIESEYYKAILDGMDEVTSAGGTAYSVFKDFPIKVGGKTGTASVGSGTPTGVFACCAPVEDPQVVVIVVIEHGVSGGSVAPVAKALLEKWIEIEKREADSGILVP